jgi:hypothetical protein
MDSLDAADYEALHGQKLTDLMDKVREINNYPRLVEYLDENRLGENLDKVIENADIFGSPTIFGQTSSKIQRKNDQWHFECPTEFMALQKTPKPSWYLTTLDIKIYRKFDQNIGELLYKALDIPQLPGYPGHSYFLYRVHESPSDKIDKMMRRAMSWYDIDHNSRDRIRLEVKPLSPEADPRLSPLEKAFVAENLFIF